MFRRRKLESQQPPPEPEPRCSFCNKSRNEVGRMIAGPVACICDECVRTCVDIIADDLQAARDAAGRAAETTQSTGDSRLVGTACALCGFPVVFEKALPIEERGFLCRGCVDAVAAAIAERK